MNPLDARLGVGTLDALQEAFTPYDRDWRLDLLVQGDESIRIIFEWTAGVDRSPRARGEIVWRWAENAVVFVGLVVEEPYRGMGFYRWIASRSEFFRDRGVQTFIALSLAQDADFLASQGEWEPASDSTHEWSLDAGA